MRLSYLVQRGDLYYFQCRVPADLLYLFPVTQIRKSLKTKDKRQASTLVKGLAAKTERLFFMARTRMLSPKMMQALAQEYMDGLLDYDKRDRYGIYETPLDLEIHELQQESDAYFLRDTKQTYQMLEEASGEMIEVTGAENLASYYRACASGSENQMLKQNYEVIKAPYCSQRQSDYVHPKMHNQSCQ
jgi:hypothetical protein